MDEDEYTRVLVCNNACWAIGEIARKIPEQAQSHLVDIINGFTLILSVEKLEQLSQKNKELLGHFSKTVAITLGRLCQIDPRQLAFCLPKIIKPWCIALRYIPNSDEKIQAF